MRHKKEERSGALLAEERYGLIRQSIDTILVLKGDGLVLCIPHLPLVGDGGMLKRVGRDPELVVTSATSGWHDVAGAFAEMPFADIARVITAPRKEHWQGSFIVPEDHAVADDAG